VNLIFPLINVIQTSDNILILSCRKSADVWKFQAYE